MSHSPTDREVDRTTPSPEEIEVVRRAQAEMMSGGSGDAAWDAVAGAMATVVMGPSALARSEPEEFTVYGEGVPASIAYLHSIVARGLGDSYNYSDGKFVVEIRPEDRVREPSLRNVRAITLCYRREAVVL